MSLNRHIVLNYQFLVGSAFAIRIKYRSYKLGLCFVDSLNIYRVPRSMHCVDALNHDMEFAFATGARKAESAVKLSNF